MALPGPGRHLAEYGGPGLRLGPGQGLPGTIENGPSSGLITRAGKNNFAMLADPKIRILSMSAVMTSQPGINSTAVRPEDPCPIKSGPLITRPRSFGGTPACLLSSPPAVDHWTPTTPYNGQWLPITDNFAASGTTPHADSRTLIFDTCGNLLETNDGGIYRRSLPQSSTGHWTSLIGNLQVTEMLWPVLRQQHAHPYFRQSGCRRQRPKPKRQRDTQWHLERAVGSGRGLHRGQRQQPHLLGALHERTRHCRNFTRVKVDPKITS